MTRILNKKQIEIKDEDCKGTDAYYNKNIQRLLQSEYVIFLTYKFVKYKYLRFFSSNNLLKYFNKYNVVYLHYYDKQEILKLINKIRINFLFSLLFIYFIIIINSNIYYLI